MESTVRRIQKRRRFAEDFKKKIVKDFENGSYSVLELSKLHHIGFQTIYGWIYKYSNTSKKGYRVVEMTESSENKVKSLKQRIKELESIVGRKQIKIDFLEKMIDLAKEDLQIDIKKNYSTPQSDGLENTKTR